MGGAHARGGFWTLEQRRRAVLFGVGAMACAFVVGIGLAASGCSKDAPAPDNRSRRGEACRATSDCVDGLACEPIPAADGGAAGGGGICVTGQFNISVTSKECELVECSAASDCCDPQLAVGCNELQQLCAMSGNKTSQQCVQFAMQCGCQTGTIECLGNKCVSHCNADQDCQFLGTGQHCFAGNCVVCAMDSECPSGQACANGKCEPSCASDGDCPGFDRCVGGRCLQSGCQSDRECVAATRNVDSRCGTDGKCIIPCETDLECGSPTDYAFFSCIDKQCTYVGCDTDKDCALLLITDASSAAQHAVCKDKPVGVVQSSSP
jgi:hypothetical protein